VPISIIHSTVDVVDSANIWIITGRKFCISQFKGRKSANKALRNAIIKAKGYVDLDALVKDWIGSDEFNAIKAAIDARATAPPILLPASDGSISPPPALLPKSCEETASTPPGWRGNPDPVVVHGAPLLPANERRIPVPAGISKRDPGTPTPLALPPRTEPASVLNGILPVM
jgi:tRNA-dihydrouridine synthase 2